MYWLVSDPRYAIYRHGDVIPPGNWGRIVRAMREAHPNWRQEVLLESRREVVNPSAPSRLSSTYLYTSLRIARRWARPGMYIHPAIPLSRPFRSDLVYTTWIQEMLLLICVSPITATDFGGRFNGPCRTAMLVATD